MFRGHLINILANSFDQCAFLFSQSVDDGTVFGLVVVHNEKKKMLVHGHLVSQSLQICGIIHGSSHDDCR